MQDNSARSDEAPGGDKLPGASPRFLQVWDLPVRVFHWLLAISVLSAWGLAGINGLLHETFGYIVLALILFRVWWGLAGTRHARFRDFVHSPRSVAKYLIDLRFFRSKRHVGHNPAGGAMIVVFLLLLFVISATGIMQTTRLFFGVGWVEQIHHWASTVLIWLIPLHVLGVVVSSVLHRENLVKSMFTGRKPAFSVEEVQSAERDREELLMDRVRSSEAFAFLAVLLAGGAAIGLTTVDKMREREKLATAAEAKIQAATEGSPTAAGTSSAEAPSTRQTAAVAASVPPNPIEVVPNKKSAGALRDLQDYLIGGPETPSYAWMLSSGGRLYDRWYAALGRPAPTENHPSWPVENTIIKGAETWRCKSCHGWDYMGREGQYRTGTNATGVRGLQRMRGRPVDEIMAILENKTHRFTDDVMSGNARERLAMFVSQGQHVVGQYFHPDGWPKGNVDRGRDVFQNVCAACHGFDGKARRLGVSANPAYTGDPIYIGTKATINPVEVLHKIRNGQPGAMMVSLRSLPMQAAVDLLAYAQTLPTR